MTTPISLYNPYISGNAKKYVNECLDSTWISSKGKFLSLFEKSFCDYTNIRSSTCCSNGTVAIHLALMALGIKAGDEIIVPTFTYIASVNTIVMAGAKPVFIDSLEDTLQLDPAKIEEKITDKTKAIIVPHLYGFAADIDAIMAIAKRHNLYVVEDCAEALGTFYKGKHVGTFGDIATFSFFGNKTITTGEGGMVASNNEALIKKCVHIKGQGLESLNPNKNSFREYWHDIIGYNYRMTNIQAAIGLSQIEIIKEILEKKTFVAETYKQHLDNNKIKILASTNDIISSYWMVVLIFDNAQIVNKVRAALHKNYIETRPLFPPVHTMDMYKNAEHLEVAENISPKGINVPSYPELTTDQIKHICNIINQNI